MLFLGTLREKMGLESGSLASVVLCEGSSRRSGSLNVGAESSFWWLILAHPRQRQNCTNDVCGGCH